MSSNDMQHMILKSFFTNDEFMRRTVPFMQPTYFEGVHKDLFKEFAAYVAKYNNLPSQEAFRISIGESEKMTEDMYRHAMDILPDLFTKDTETDLEFLMDKTEKWCQDRAVHNAIMESITIIDGKHPSLSKNALPDLLTKALGVTFDTQIGHDYIEDFQKRFDFYHTEEEKDKALEYSDKFVTNISKGYLSNFSSRRKLLGFEDDED